MKKSLKIQYAIRKAPSLVEKFLGATSVQSLKIVYFYKALVPFAYFTYLAFKHFYQVHLQGNNTVNSKL